MSYKQYKHLIQTNFMGIRDKVKNYGKAKVKPSRGKKKSN
jgi:hypothetical protein